MANFEKNIISFLKHCKKCPDLNISINWLEEIYYCSKLINEKENTLAVIKYNSKFDIIDFEFLNFYPKSCPREKK